MTLRLAQAAEVRLGRQRSPQYEQGDHLLPYLRSANVVDGSLDLTDVKSMNFDPVEQQIFALAEGDVLMTEGSGSPETVGTSAVWRAEIPGTVCFQNTLLRLRPRPGITDGRFLAWWARHAHASGQIAAVSTGANIQHIGADGLKSLRIHVPTVEEQRRIADFLDDRVARIDQIITARGTQLAAVTSIPWSRFAQDQRLTGAAPTPLRRTIAFLADGPFGSAFSSSDYSTAGAAVIRLGDIGLAEFRGKDLARVPEEIYARFPRTHVGAGDLLIASLGDERNHAGRACVAPVSLGKAMVKGKSFLARPVPEVAAAEFLAVLLSSPLGAENLVRQGTGATRNMLNFERLLSAVFPLPDLKTQLALIAEFEAELERARSAAISLQRSESLLAEYKQSLITAAVSGELDVTTAGNREPGMR